MTTQKRRGFAARSAEERKEIARKGGRAAHARGLAHEFTRQEAQAAGRKGGLAISADRAHMSEIGKKGGHASGRARRLQDSLKRAAAGYFSPE